MFILIGVAAALTLFAIVVFISTVNRSNSENETTYTQTYINVPPLASPRPIIRRQRYSPVVPSYIQPIDDDDDVATGVAVGLAIGAVESMIDNSQQQQVYSDPDPTPSYDPAPSYDPPVAEVTDNTDFSALDTSNDNSSSYDTSSNDTSSDFSSDNSSSGGDF